MARSRRPARASRPGTHTSTPGASAPAPAPHASRRRIPTAWLRALGAASLLVCLAGVAAQPAPVLGFSGGEEHMCALLEDGSVHCWGTLEWMALGDAQGIWTPTPLPGVGPFVELDSGHDFACGLRADGTVACWGVGRVGQLGNGDTADSPTPVEVSGLAEVVRLAVGNAHACGLRADGTVHCWGHARAVGVDTVANTPTPVQLPGLSDIVDLAAVNAYDWNSESASCALQRGGQVFCWGHNREGALGTGDLNFASVPVPGPRLPNAIRLAAGGQHFCALGSSGEVWCWGANHEGELGLGARTTTLEIVQVEGLPPTITALALGTASSCALDGEGMVWCWGANRAGQLGRGDQDPAPGGPGDPLVPAPAADLRGVVTLGSSSLTVCGYVPQDGTSCWGGRDSGGFGDGSQEFLIRPAKVPW